MSVAIAVLAIVVLVAAGLAIAIIKLARRRSEPAPDIEWCRRFTTARYRPMERLLHRDDYEFLKAQPGFDAEIGRRLEKARRTIFRKYLRSLSRDFERLMAAAAVVMTNSHEDRPELARVLFLHRVAFAWAMCQVRVRLALNGIGIGTVDIRPLVDVLESARARLPLHPPAAVHITAA